jgi:hypothetical protein
MGSITPQIASSAPENIFCPKCGRKMQLLTVRPSIYSYVCYAHSLQNSDSSEPYYLNIPFKSVSSDGKVKEKDSDGPIRPQPLPKG